MVRSPPPGTAGRRHRRRLAVAGLITVLLVVTFVAATRYQPALTRAQIPAGTDLERAAARMLTKASAIRAGLIRTGDWGEAISDVEVNAWLMHDLPRIAPTALPTWVRSPAIRFLPRRVAVSAHVGTGLLAARWWALLDVTLRRDNELAIGVDSAGLGAVPFPPGPVLDALEAGARQAGLQAQRGTFEGRPTLIVSLPGRIDGAEARGSEYHLEGLRVDDGEAVIAGSTRPPLGR